MDGRENIVTVRFSKGEIAKLCTAVSMCVYLNSLFFKPFHTSSVAIGFQSSDSFALFHAERSVVYLSKPEN